MTLFCETGTFAKETSNVDGTDQTVNLVDTGLTPKVLWLWTAGVTTANAYAEHSQMSYGFSDGTNDACVSCSQEDNVNASDTGGIIRNDAVLCILDEANVATINSQADVVSFNAGNFVLNWAVSDAEANIIHYIVMGGTDITNVKVTSHTLSSAAGTGDEAYTGVGFGGDFINIITPLPNGTAVNTAVAHGGFTIGAATSSSARWMWGGSAEDNSASANTFSYKEIAQFQGTYDSTGGQVVLGNFSSFDADGFTINYSVEGSAANTAFASLVIKGGLWNVGNGTAPASTGQQTINTTSGRDPEAVMFFTWGTTATSSGVAGEAEMRMGIGAADNALHENTVSMHDDDAQSDMVITRISLDTKMIRTHTANATAGSSTTIAEADIIDMDNDGNFIIDWTTTLSSMAYVYFVVSQAVAGGAADDGGYGADVFNMFPMLISAD